MIRKIIALSVCTVFLFMTGCAMETLNDVPEDPIEDSIEEVINDMPQTEDITSEADDSMQPGTGGTLKLSMRKPATLNPLLNEDITVDSILKLVFMQLVTLDENMRPTPWLAEEINFASDGMNALITLRDMYWSDGVQVTAEDLVFSVNTLKNAPDGAIYKQNVENILNCSVIDDKTVRINYTHGFSAADYLLCFPVIPHHYYINETSKNSEKNMSPLGNYIYNLDSYDGRDNLKLYINEGYNGEKPKIQQINVLVTSDATTDLSAFDQGLIDVLGTKLSDWGKYRGSKQTNIYEYPTTYFDFIGFNFNNPVLADIRVRQAIIHSIDLDKLVNDIYHSSATRSYTPICPQSWLYEPDVKKYGFDLDAAKDLYVNFRRPEVEAAADEHSEEGSPEESEINMELEEIKLVILANEENEERVKIANALAEAINKIGPAATVEILPFADYEAKLSSRDYDIFVGGINFSIIPDLTFALHSSQANTGMNFFSYKNDKMDMLLAHSFAYSTPSSYHNAMSELQKHIAEDLPLISVCFRKSVLLTDKAVLGEIKPVQNDMFFSISKWFIREQSASTGN